MAEGGGPGQRGPEVHKGPWEQARLAHPSRQLQTLEELHKEKAWLKKQGSRLVLGDHSVVQTGNQIGKNAQYII